MEIKYQTKQDVEQIRKILFVFNISLIVIMIGAPLVFWIGFKMFTWWSELIFIAGLAMLIYRLCRQDPRRCPYCRKKGWWAGWFTTRKYWREIPPLHNANTGHFDVQQLLVCVYARECHSCGREYEYKPREPKVLRRPFFLENW